MLTQQSNLPMLIFVTCSRCSEPSPLKEVFNTWIDDTFFKISVEIPFFPVTLGVLGDVYRLFLQSAFIKCILGALEPADKLST